jgi:hypothetical protein
MIKLGEFHDTETKRFLEPLSIPERVVGIESHVIDAPCSRAPRDVVLRPVGFSGPRRAKKCLGPKPWRHCVID